MERSAYETAIADLEGGVWATATASGDTGGRVFGDLVLVTNSAAKRVVLYGSFCRFV